MKIMFRRCGFVYTDCVLERYREINYRVWESYKHGKISKDALQTKRFTELFEQIGAVCDAKKFNDAFLYEMGKNANLIEGAEDICKLIVSRGKKIYIVSNGIIITQESRMEHSPIKKYVSDFFVSERAGFRKPEAGFFDYVFAHIQSVKKENILIVGDSLTADIKGGRGAGIKTCWFNPDGKENCTDISPDYEIRRLSELEVFL
ncbi:MAG: YjjG family noncanonical pyrimidine nucleotidase [Defluviitaleaceae bacterium]|nr:YjjG family noncanonical pyrimidine nucleotidase [Defluviitaleaceae bacterium]